MVISRNTATIVLAIVFLLSVVGAPIVGAEPTFDRFYLLVLVIIAIFAIRQINVFTCIVIIIAARGVEETVWLMNISNGIELLLFYLTVAAVCFTLRRQLYAKIVIPVIATAMLADIYWFYIGVSGPQINWSVFMILENWCLGVVFMKRYYWTDNFFPGRAELIDLDLHLNRISIVAVLIHSAALFEYYVRWFTPANPLWVWQYMSYLILGLQMVYLVAVIIALIQPKMRFYTKI